MKLSILLLTLSSILAFVHCYGGNSYNPLWEAIKARRSQHPPSNEVPKDYPPVHIAPEDGLKEADRIEALPGQPSGLNLSQYSGYVTVDSTAGRAFFYYFVESQNSSTTPLVLWLNGGPGCSSFGNGAMTELGPFRVNSDGKTLSWNKYAWTNLANVLFLESPAGVGFSYSNTSSDYDLNGDAHTAQDNYIFLLNWLERFPEYKTRDFYITGESYAGHYAPQLAQKIIRNNKITNQTVINLKGMAIGNAWIDDEMGYKGMYDNYWTRALVSDEVHDGITSHCDFSKATSPECENYTLQADDLVSNIYEYNVYAPVCPYGNGPLSSSSSSSITEFDPCTHVYTGKYLNTPQVQSSLHVIGALPRLWLSCNITLRFSWTDWQTTILPTIQELMHSGIKVWAYSGDVDGIVPTTTTRYSLNKMGVRVKTPWYPWYYQGEVGGYVEGYGDLTLVTVRGAGHFVPSYQPGRALAVFSSFIAGKLPPRSPFRDFRSPLSKSYHFWKYDM